MEEPHVPHVGINPALMELGAHRRVNPAPEGADLPPAVPAASAAADDPSADSPTSVLDSLAMDPADGEAQVAISNQLYKTGARRCEAGVLGQEESLMDGIVEREG